MRLLPSDPYHHQPNTMHYALHLISAHQVAIAFWVADKKYITHKYNHATHIPHISKHSVHSHQLDLLDLAKLVRKQFAIKVILSVMGLQHARKLLAHSSCCLWPTYHHIHHVGDFAIKRIGPWAVGVSDLPHSPDTMHGGGSELWWMDKMEDI